MSTTYYWNLIFFKVHVTHITRFLFKTQMYKCHIDLGAVT